MNFCMGMLSAPIKWRVTLKRKATATVAGQAGRSRVEDVTAPSVGAAKKAALAVNNNHRLYDVESVREVR